MHPFPDLLAAPKQKLLRTSLVQPLSSTTQLATIMARQDFVNLLIQSEEAFFDLSEMLKGFPDLELICATSRTSSRTSVSWRKICCYAKRGCAPT